MRWISAIAISLLLTTGLVVDAQAVTSGVYKCYVTQGPTSDSSTLVVPDVIHYNPNGTGFQSITRIRIFDSLGSLLFDQSYPYGAFTVNARGSDHAAVPTTGLAEGLQVMVNWRQSVNGAPPIPRLILLLFDSISGTYTSVSQSNCQ